MKKILTGLMILSIILMLFVNIVIAIEDEDVSFNVTENETNSSYTVNIDIQISGNDTHLREDVYGTGNTQDAILNGADGDSETELREICSQPSLQAYFNEIGDIPPSGFVDYLKSLGYDDEAHMSFIWNLCQQEYINQQEALWSQDLIGGGVQQGDLVSIFRSAIGWLSGNGDSVYANARDLAMILESYFASDKDVWILANRINQLELRVESLERTLEEIAPEEFCDVKVDMMKMYNLTGVKCGVNSTIYWNAEKAGFDNYDIIAYRDCNEDWICTEWSECVDGIQTRKCVDKYACGTFYSKPAESQECTVTMQKIIETPFKSVTTASKVETYQTIEQILSENYKSILCILLIALISISTSLIFIGVKKDYK